MEQTVAKQTDLEEPKLGPGKYKRKRSQELIARDIRAYELHLNGSSIRAIGEDIGLKSSRSAWEAVRRGGQYVEENGVNLEKRRIEIDQLFKNTLGHLAGEIARQVDEGRIQTIERSDGSREIRRTKGVDPRTAEALARSADRWAQFLGITDRAQEVNAASTTLIQLSAPADGASFGDRWSGGETVDAHVMPTDQQVSAQTPVRTVMSHSLPTGDPALPAADPA